MAIVAESLTCLGFLLGCFAPPLDAPQNAPPKQPKIDVSWTWVETPHGKPVIDRGLAGSWEHYAVDNPYVFREGGKYYCFYEAQDKLTSQGGHERIGLAVSDDGIQWRKSDHNPMLDVGADGAWDDVVAKLPAGVIRHDGRYWLFYSGRDSGTKQIGLATADRLDGKWIKAKENPVLRSRPAAWDKLLSTYATPIFELHGAYYLLYRGMQGRYHDQAPGLAVSSDLIRWRRVPEAQRGPLIPVTEEIGSLAVVWVNGRFVGISQPKNLNKRCYWYSDDLIKWRKGPKVRFRASTAAESLSNPFIVNGQWNVLYEQKDRIYRAVLSPAK